jgi:hypothetical protein
MWHYVGLLKVSDITKFQATERQLSALGEGGLQFEGSGE